MSGPFRRFPFRGLALVALGFLLASVLAGGTPAFAGAAAGLGLALVIPVFLFKMVFMVVLLGSFLRFAGGGWGRGRHPGRGPGGARYRPGDESSSVGHDRSFDRERWEWEESLRRAREELREFDTPFSRPPPGFEPPAQGSED
jgi:hypothetical protein